MVSRAKIEACVLRIPQSKAGNVEVFFTQVLGMSLRRSTETVRVFAPFPDTTTEAALFPWLEAGVNFPKHATQSCDVAFQLMPDADCALPKNDATSIYWKIGLTTDNVDKFADHINQLAVERMPWLAKAGMVGKGSQFLDIGYLTHLRDPAGFTIELLQTTFEQNRATREQLCAERAAVAGSMTTRIESGALAVGQITTRIADPKVSLAFYQDVLGMRLLSVQPVTPYRFTLYFLAWTDEQPPAPQNVEAVENREWCWQRPYTTLELQHSWDTSGSPGTVFAVPAVCQAPAFGSMTVTVADRALFDGIKVPFVDVLTGMLDPTLPLTVHEFAEWGDPREGLHEANLRALSPYENVGSHRYPPMYLSCAREDSRVPPWMPLKLAARVRARAPGFLDAGAGFGARRRKRSAGREASRSGEAAPGEPLLVLHCAGGGHGGAADWHGRTEEFARQIVFLYKALGLAME